MMWVNFALLAVCVMLSGISCLSSNALTTVGKLNDPDPYPIQRFNTQSTDRRRSYVELIRGIRDMLTDDQLDPVYEIPRLHARESVPMSRRFLLLELINSNEDTITLALDTTRLYLVGYRTRNAFYYFSDTAQDVETLFPDLPHSVLPFTSGYEALAQEAGNRRQIDLGIGPLERAINNLHEYRRGDLAQAFTVLIQMFSEAIRFRYIEDYIGNLITRQADEHPSATMLDLQNAWDPFSTRLQNSRDGTISPAVPITNREGNRNPISTVTRGLILNIGILFYVCNRPPNANQLLPSSQSTSSTTLHTDGGSNHTNITEPIIRFPVQKGAGHMKAGDTCNIVEPTVRIVGRDGLCATVKDGSYHNGDAILRAQCKSNDVVNQLWTLKADGTIRSNGMCLTAYSYKDPGSYIMVFDCETAIPDATKWEIWVNGTIFNPRSSLVLSGTWGIGTELTLQVNVYSTSQAWVVANNTQPIVTPIMNNGQFGMCIQSLDYRPEIIYHGCQSGERRQMFAVYPDGSIRPNDKRDDCLTANYNSNFIIIAGCNGGAEQRWLFKRDNTISNMDTGLVMDAGVNYNFISLSISDELASQEWQAWFL